MKLKLLLMIMFATTFSMWLPTSGQAHPATGIVADRAGNVYFSDLETIWKFSAAGKLTIFLAGQRGRHIHELAIDDQGNVYGGNVSYNPATKGWPSSVWKMTPAGDISYLLETTENPPRGMSIWRDRGGNMYWIDQNNHTKTQTLLLRRTPDGMVTTFAGSAYGHADGKGTAARFGSVGGMAFGPDGSLFLTDGDAIRRVSMDGNVTTISKGLDFREPKDERRFLSGLSGSLTGLTVAPNGNIYAADSSNRRLLKITPEGKAEVVLRTEPPFFPNGVAAVGTDVYVLEVGFTLPNISSGPRVRKISADGRQSVLVTIGAGSDRSASSLAMKAGVTAEKALVLFTENGRLKYTLVLISMGLLTAIVIVGQRIRRRRT